MEILSRFVTGPIELFCFIFVWLVGLKWMQQLLNEVLFW